MRTNLLTSPADIIADLSKDEPSYDRHDISSCNGSGAAVQSLINTREKRGKTAFERKLESIKASDPELHHKLTGEAPAQEEEKEDSRLVVGKYGRKRFPTFKQSDIEDFPDIQFLVKDILPTTGVSLLVAPSGTGKTYYLIDLANHVARNMEWNGRKTKSGQVLFIYLEGKLGLKPREKAWRKYHGLGMTDNIDYMSVPMDLMKDHEYIDAVIDELQQDQGSPYSLIIVDTFSNVTRGVDQNKQELVTMVLEVFHQIADKWQTQVLVTHHTNKQGTANGSMSFKNHVDTMIELSSLDNGPITVHCEKQRDGAPPFDDFMLQRQLIEIGFDAETFAPVFNCVLIPYDGATTQELITLDEQERILDIIKVQQKITGNKWVSECKEVGISKRTLYKLIPALETRGIIACQKATRNGQADYYTFIGEEKSREEVKQEPCTPDQTLPGKVCKVYT